MNSHNWVVPNVQRDNSVFSSLWNYLRSNIWLRHNTTTQTGRWQCSRVITCSHRAQPLGGTGRTISYIFSFAVCYSCTLRQEAKSRCVQPVHSEFTTECVYVCVWACPFGMCRESGEPWGSTSDEQEPAHAAHAAHALLKRKKCCCRTGWRTNQQYATTTSYSYSSPLFRDVTLELPQCWESMVHLSFNQCKVSQSQPTLNLWNDGN